MHSALYIFDGFFVTRIQFCSTFYQCCGLETLYMIFYLSSQAYLKSRKIPNNCIVGNVKSLMSRVDRCGAGKTSNSKLWRLCLCDVNLHARFAKNRNLSCRYCSLITKMTLFSRKVIMFYVVYFL